MKPITNWTLEEKNQFWTLFMGRCWHEWELDGRGYGTIRCIHCSVSYDYYIDSEPPERLKNLDYYSSLSGFQIIKEYMEKEMSEMWEEYLYWCGRKHAKTAREGLNIILDLSNFITFLLDNQEGWGWKACKHRKEWPRVLPDGGSAFFCEKECGDPPLNCNGTGKVKHPAWVYWESVKVKEEK